MALLLGTYAVKRCKCPFSRSENKVCYSSMCVYHVAHWFRINWIDIAVSSRRESAGFYSRYCLLNVLNLRSYFCLFWYFFSLNLRVEKLCLFNNFVIVYLGSRLAVAVVQSCRRKTRCNILRIRHAKNVAIFLPYLFY